MTKRSSPRELSELFHHRWTAPLLALLHRDRGAKFVTVVNRLGLPRDSAQKTLATLIDAGLVRRNEGYGHPMRPEYLLGRAAEPIAEPLARLCDLVERRQLESVAYKKWSLPALAAIGAGAERFGDVRAALPGVTPRALTLALKDLLDADLIERVLLDTFPPVAAYRLTRAAKPIVKLLDEIVRA